MRLFGIFVFLAVPLVACKPAVEKTYKVQGSVTMTNGCTNNAADLPDAIRVDAILHYSNRAEEKFGKEFPTRAAGGNQKTANYEFEVHSGLRGVEWEVERVVNSTFGPICTPIPCENGVCTNVSPEKTRAKVKDGPSPIVTANNVVIDCQCK
jgi:hypothetical protein